MIRRCRRCSRWVFGWRPFCRGRRLDECLHREWVNTTVAPVEWRALLLRYPGAGAAVDWLASLPVRPDPLVGEEPWDIAVCSVCKGDGSVRSRYRDYETGGRSIIECPNCEGSGVEPTYQQSEELRRSIARASAYWRQQNGLVPA
jgi:hypothetical protein